VQLFAVFGECGDGDAAALVAFADEERVFGVEQTERQDALQFFGLDDFNHRYVVLLSIECCYPQIQTGMYLLYLCVDTSLSFISPNWFGMNLLFQDSDRYYGI